MNRENIGVVDLGWCSEMTGKIQRLDENCKFQQFFIIESLTTSADAADTLGVMDPGWCSEITELTRRLDDKCRFDQFFIIESLTSVDAESIGDIGVMDPGWCSEMTQKIKRLHEKCKFQQFFILESLTSVESPIGVMDLGWGPKMRGEIRRLDEKCKFDQFFIPSGNLTSVGANSEYFKYFNSTKEASNKILMALEDESGSCIIGLHGRKGSGKTALVNAEKPKYEKIFDTVLSVSVIVTKQGEVDIINTQNQITPQLNMNSQAFRSQSRRASAIESTLLENKGKILVIFDHVSTNFLPRHMQDIGIPDPSNHCKILLITHDKKYCNMMGCHPWIHLPPLSKDDAWNLLQQYSGIDDDDSSNKDLFEVAHEVALRCKGLPGLIEDVVSFLNNKNTEEGNKKLKDYWTETLDCLKHETASYQIFISFRGTDTRDDFTESLYDALDGAGFKVFIDRKIPSGDQVSETLINAIEQSRASIVILSANYADSSWCLDELLKIMECREKIKQLVYPIFYKVDPSDVRHVKGTYKEAMAKKEERFGKDKVQEWTSVLFRVAGLSGNHHSIGSHKKFIQEVVEYVKDNKHRLHIL